MSLFSTLNTGYSGMSAAELATSVTGNNIANANNDYYTRQRVMTSASTPFDTTPGSIGTGVTVTSIERIHDEFVYGRLKDTSNNLSYDEFSKQTLNEIAGYFPDLQDSGIGHDLANYFDSWNSLSTNAGDGSQKVALVQNASTLSSDIASTREQLRATQDSLNTQIKANIKEVNSMGEQIADINQRIAMAESVSGNNANDLRDRRDNLELNLSKILNVTISKGNITSKNVVDQNATDQGENYNINIAGNSFVDGSTFHPLSISNENNKSNYYSIYVPSKDGTKQDLTSKITGGKMGAMLDIRGRSLDNSVKGGYPSDGVLQGYIDDLDTFSNTLITQTNGIYAQSASDKMNGPSNLNLNGDISLMSSDLHVSAGTFDVVMYDSNGAEAGRKTITINQNTTMSDDSLGKSIITQINSQTDDNGDNNSTNDISSKFTAYYSKDNAFSILPKDGNISGSFKIALEDSNTNFAGSIGINQFFSGSSAKDISVKQSYARNPSLIHGYKAPIDGNNDVANSMVQLQYDNLNFHVNSNNITQDSLSGFYGAMTTKIASDGEQAGNNVDTSKALFNTVQTEFQSISSVSTDQELTNLMKFQTAYSANAKIITTVDQMMTTLLGIKR